jgi:NADH-quinone oxidoreductase subunit D
LAAQSYLGKRGDSYDRFLIRIREMYESVNLIFQLLLNFSKTDFAFLNDTKTVMFFNFCNKQNYQKLNNNAKYDSMETLINHFKNYSEGVKVPRGFTYNAIEAPKGEFGVSLITDGTSNPYRCKIRTPAYHHMQVMPRLVQGHFFADLVTVLGSQDIVFGDVDR